MKLWDSKEQARLDAILDAEEAESKLFVKKLLGILVIIGLMVMVSIAAEPVSQENPEDCLPTISQPC